MTWGTFILNTCLLLYLPRKNASSELQVQDQNYWVHLFAEILVQTVPSCQYRNELSAGASCGWLWPIVCLSHYLETLIRFNRPKFTSAEVPKFTKCWLAVPVVAGCDPRIGRGPSGIFAWFTTVTVPWSASTYRRIHQRWSAEIHQVLAAGWVWSTMFFLARVLRVRIGWELKKCTKVRSRTLVLKVNDFFYRVDRGLTVRFRFRWPNNNK